MKKAAAFILLLLFSLQTFSNTCMIAWYRINKKYIASTLCVNRYRPRLHCDGKCFLAQKLKQAEQNQEDNSSQTVKQWVETVPCTLTSGGFEILPLIERKVYTRITHSRYSSPAASSVFHPPCRH